MNPEQILFFVFGSLSLAGAISVISFRHPIYSALALIVTFFAQAGLFVLLGAHFVAAAQVIVYAGAIMVLFLFVIMLLNLGRRPPGSAKGRGKWKGIAVILGILFAAEGIYIAVNALNDNTAVASAEPAAESVTTYDIGALLFSKYLLPFEVTSLILLAALIGVIVLVKRERPSKISGITQD